MKNIKKNGIILSIITILVLVLVIKDDFSSILQLFQNANIFWIFLAVLMQAGLLFFETLAFHQILKSYKKNYLFRNTLKLDLITKFFNGITPFSTGGQPMQVYYLKKEGFRLTKATNAIMQNFILYQTALITVGLVALALNHHYNYFAQVPILKQLITIGFLLNTLVMVLLFVVSFSSSFNKFIIDKAIRLLHKIGIIKKKEETREKWLERCNDFHEGATYIKEHKLLCFKGYIYNILGLLCSYAIPFFIAKSMDSTATILLIPTIVATSYVNVMGAFVPIPGASGGIEYGFLQFFGNFISGSLLSATLLIWRTITYYIPMIVGAVVMNMRKDG